jgi:predicted ATPase
MTVLVGPNDTGKSAFLAAVQALIVGSKPDQHEHWQGDRKQAITIRGASTVGEGWLVTDAQGGHRKDLAGMPALQPVRLFQFPSQGVPMEAQGSPDGEGPPEIGQGGSNVATLFDYLLRQDRDRYDNAVETLRALIPGLKAINVGTPHVNTRRVDLVLEGGFRMPADRASTGVRMILAFVALAYHPTPPRVILLEEPETGVHPRRLREIVELLRDITQGKHGQHAAQVILTTHSPYLLDYISLDTDQVLVFRREEDGSRTAEPADRTRLEVFRDEFLLGEVWFNQGEEGLVAPRK